VVSYLRSFRPERQPPRRRRRADPDAARWCYDEVDDERRSLRHVEMRADDGTYLVAATRGSVPDELLPRPGADAEEMTPEAFAEVWRLARGRLDGVAEVEIFQVQPRTEDGLPVVVRCVGGAVRVGSRLDRIRETGEPVTITVARIVVFDRDVEQITPLHSATLILSGAGPARIHAGQHLDGRTA
jgi:hypothetical protein